MSGGEGEKTDMIEEEEDMMLRQLKRQKTHATINTDHLDLLEKVVPNGVTNETTNGHVDIAPKDAESNNTLSRADRKVTFDEKAPHKSLTFSSTQTQTDSGSN